MGTNVCGYCGPRSLNAHVPFKFFFYFTPPQTTTWLKLDSKACQRICTCDEGPCPPSPSFCFLRHHLSFASSPPFSSTFLCLEFLLDFQSNEDLKLSLTSFSSCRCPIFPQGTILAWFLSIFGMFLALRSLPITSFNFIAKFPCCHGSLPRVHCSHPWCH